MQLTETKIRRLICPPEQWDRLVFDDEQRGLAVRVMASGSRSYLAQYTLHGRKRRVPIDSFDAISLADARKAAAAIMGEVARGEDPAAERKAKAEAARSQAERERLTLATLVGDWHRLHLSSRKPRYAAEAVRALQNAFGAAWDRPADGLDRQGVVRVLDRLPASMAARTAAYGRACFAWAMKRGTLTTNPFERVPVTTTPARDRVLSDGELVAILGAAEAEGWPFGSLVRVLALTGQRREETAGMAWAEVSGDLLTWTIPGNRTKNGVPHIVPLSDPARAILRAAPHHGPLVFGNPAGKPFNGWSKAKARLDRESGVTGWRLHDLRRTLATGLQRLGVRLEVTEAVLNHTSGSRSGIVGVYQRHTYDTEKRSALEAWAGHVLGLLMGGALPANVVRLAG
jgi:integrase